jgi:hypothetical protein
MMIAKRVIGTFFILSLVINARADFPFGKGRKILFPSFSFSSAQRNYDRNGSVVSMGQGAGFSSTSFALFFGYGIGRNLDFSANIPFANQVLKSASGKLTNAGFGDAFFSLSYHIPSEDLKNYFTLRTGLYVPMYAGSVTPSLGYGNNGLSLGANYSFSPYKDGFCIADLTHIRYFADDGSGPNVTSYNITFGKSFNVFHLFTIGLTHTDSKSVNKNFSFDLPQNRDFTTGRITLGYGRRASRMMMPFFQVYYTPYGRNAGASYGASFSIISKLPL